MELDTILLEKLIAITPGNIYWKNRAGVYLGCNDNNAAILKLKHRNEIIGKGINELLEKKFADPIATNDEMVMSQNKEICFEEDWLDEDGQHAIYLTRKIPLHGTNGEVIGMLGISFNITERKRMEEDLRRAKEELERTNRSKQEYIEKMFYLDEIISLLPGNVYWKNTAGFFLGCNDNVAQIFKFSSRKEMVGKTLHDLMDKEMADAIGEQDNLVMQHDMPKSFEENGLNVDGKVVTYLTRKAPMHDEYGNVVGLVGVSIDISERKQFEAALRVAKDKAEVASQVKTEFIHNMEHDIRTPFNGVWGIANHLWHQETDHAKKTLLADIKNCANELLDYCNGILDFAKIEQGSLPVMHKKFDVKKLVESVIAIETPAAKLKNLSMTFEYDSKVPAIVIGDSYRLQRILINLLSNAVKFTQQGGIKVGVKLMDLRAQKNAVIRFMVEDTGIGIPLEKQDFIYEKFVRLIPANKEVYKGLGLGLGIVRRFIEEMGGEIECQSDSGKGTAFVCTLPFKLPLVDAIFEKSGVAENQK